VGTQLQEYSGNNFYNNNIEIDFNRRQVNFLPIKDGGFIKHYLRFLLRLSVFYSIPIIWVAVIYNIIGIILYTNSAVIISSTPGYMFAISDMLNYSIYTALGLAFIFSLAFFHKGWRNTKYPEFNYNIYRLMKKIMWLGFKSDITKEEVNPEAIVNNKFIIYDFDNVKMDYKLTGDFKKYIDKIKIINKYKKNPDEWMCVFFFKKHPKKGKMILEYM